MYKSSKEQHFDDTPNSYCDVSSVRARSEINQMEFRFSYHQRQRKLFFFLSIFQCETDENFKVVQLLKLMDIKRWNNLLILNKRQLLVTLDTSMGENGWKTSQASMMCGSVSIDVISRFVAECRIKTDT